MRNGESLRNWNIILKAKKIEVRLAYSMLPLGKIESENNRNLNRL